MKKRLLAVLCAITCALSLSACGEKVYTEKEKTTISYCEQLASANLELTGTLCASEKTVEELLTYNKEELAYIYAYYMRDSFEVSIDAELGAFNGMLTTYMQTAKEMGTVTGIGVASSVISGDKVIVTIPLTGTECSGQFVCTFSNDIFTKFIEAEATANTSFAQKMKQAGSNMGTAGLNTLLGMGTVFIMLILICFIISSFKFLSKDKKKEVKKAEAPAVAVAEPETEELSDDTELVAVIMAAISAYEGNASTDGFVVRSIRRANRRI